jgi:N-formylmaleamate deformylase
MAGPSTERLRADVAQLDAESRTVQSGDLRLHVLDYPGEEPAVIVLPGITSPAIAWDFVIRALDAGRRFVVPDMRGRGLSDTPSDGGYSLDDYAGDVAAIIEGLGLERPTLLGHSMGARIAAAVGARRPGLAGAVIAVDPPLSGPGRAPYPITREGFLNQLREAKAGTTIEAVRRSYPRWPERELELRITWLPTCDERAVLDSHEGFHTEDFFDDWPRVPAPVWFVYGGVSPMVTPEGAEEAVERNPDAQPVRVADAGHMIPWDNLDGFVRAIRPVLLERRDISYSTRSD